MITYKDSGVNKEEGYKSVDLIKDMAKATHSKNRITSYNVCYTKLLRNW